MTKRIQKISARKSLVALGMSVEVTFSLVVSSLVVAGSTFPDVSSDYWAQPFIQELTERGIVVGYPDGTFKPEQPIHRDELAVTIRQAFSQKQTKTIPSGSVFPDVPTDYWAASAIEEAYETGFMNAKADDLFMPKETVSRLEALVDLTKGLDLKYESSSAQNHQRQASEKHLVFRFPLTALMQQFFVPETVATDSQPDRPSEMSAWDYVRSRYRDAEKIPQPAINNVATAIQNSLVVNEEQSLFLNPDRPLNRGEAAAFIYRALANQGKL